MRARPFQIKICGVTTPEDAIAVAESGADAIGLNFYPRSKRYLSLEQASAIAAKTPPELVKVGVFVNPTRDELEEAIQAAALEWVQLHGDESPAFVSQLQDLAIIKAFRWDGSGRSIDEFFEICQSPGAMPRRILIDAPSATDYGGTGASADWPSIKQWHRAQSLKLPVILAGGLTPENLAAAMHESGIGLVDCASGVESSPGRKDPQRIAAFVRAFLDFRRDILR